MEKHRDSCYFRESSLENMVIIIIFGNHQCKNRIIRTKVLRFQAHLCVIILGACMELYDLLRALKSENDAKHT